MFFKKKIKLNEKQKEILMWLIHHQQLTAYSTWELLFNERKGKYPDRCIAYYDDLSPKEKAEVELIIARYFALHWNKKSHSVVRSLRAQDMFDKLCYEEIYR